MSVSRRSFLKAGAVLSAALVLKPGTFVFGQSSSLSNSLNSSPAHTYRREMFERHVRKLTPRTCTPCQSLRRRFVDPRLGNL